MFTRLPLSLGCCLCVLLASCASSPDRAAHPTAAMLDLQQSKGWLGMHTTPAKRRPTLVVRMLDGRVVRDPTLPAGLAMAPGPHVIRLSARRPKLDLSKHLGAYKSIVADKLDTAPSKHDRDLPLNAVGGHDYLAHMKPRGDSFAYWIEDVTDDVVVAKTPDY